MVLIVDCGRNCQNSIFLFNINHFRICTRFQRPFFIHIMLYKCLLWTVITFSHWTQTQVVYIYFYYVLKMYVPNLVCQKPLSNIWIRLAYSRSKYEKSSLKSFFNGCAYIFCVVEFANLISIKQQRRNRVNTHFNFIWKVKEKEILFSLSKNRG